MKWAYITLTQVGVLRGHQLFSFIMKQTSVRNGIYFYGHSPPCSFKKGCCQLQAKVCARSTAYGNCLCKLAQEKCVAR